MSVMNTTTPSLWATTPAPPKRSLLYRLVRWGAQVLVASVFLMGFALLFLPLVVLLLVGLLKPSLLLLLAFFLLLLLEGYGFQKVLAKVQASRRS